MRIKIRNWDKWQSYRKDRGQPPWIKVHRALMRDVNWVALTDAQRGQLVAIWMLAGDHDGVIPASPEIIKKLCFMDSEPDLEMLTNHGFLEERRQHDANMTHQSREHDANMTHQSREEESREEKRRREKRVHAAKGAATLPAKTSDSIFANGNGSVVAMTPQADFVSSFGQTYEVKTGEPFKAGTKDFVIAANLIKKHGIAPCVKKAMTLAILCDKKSAWFTKDGWASFNLGKLSEKWNQIIPEASQPTEEDDEREIFKKQEALRVTADHLANGR